MSALAAALAVFLGGALGGVTRWALSHIPAPRVGTFAANVTAASVLGFCAGAPALWPLAAGTGFAGALSTWSTLSKEIGQLINQREYADAARYAFLTALFGLAGAVFGLIWGRAAFGS